MISMIVAHDRNRLIGSNNSMPWHISEDLRYFKEKTMKSIVIMGRNTHESIGRPLPHRVNVILTRDPSYSVDDGSCVVVSDVERLLTVFKNYIKEDFEVFVVGGSEIYNYFLPHADKLYVTYIDHEFEGDTYFPSYEDDFELLSSKRGQECKDYEYYFKVFINKRLQ